MGEVRCYGALLVLQSPRTRFLDSLRIADHSFAAIERLSALNDSCSAVDSPLDERPSS